MKHTPFHGWGVVDARTQAAVDAGHPEWAFLPKSRKDAVARGMKRFFSGVPCIHGHLTDRCVYNGCIPCARGRGA